MKLKHNIPENVKALKKLEKKLPEEIKKGMHGILGKIGEISSSSFLRGPRPSKLDVGLTGKLIRSIRGGLGFGEGIIGTGSAAVSEANAIREVKRVGDKTVGVIGTKQLSKLGFDYPAHWEFGTDKTEPRPFLGPAVAQARNSGVLDRTMQAAVERIKLD